LTIFCVHAFIQVTDYSIRVSQSFTGAAAPLPLWVATPMIMKYNVVAQPYYCCWTHAYCIKIIAPHSPITYLSSEKKTLHCQLCSTHYAAVRINKNFCNESSHYRNYGWFPLKWKPSRAYHKNQHFLWWAKVNGTQRRTLVNPLSHCQV